MAHYERIGMSVLDEEGYTNGSNICLPNMSRIFIEAGQDFSSFQLKFANEGKGYWVHEEALGHLIAELLYIREEIKQFREQRRDAGLVEQLEQFLPEEDEVDEPPVPAIWPGEVF